VDEPKAEKPLAPPRNEPLLQPVNGVVQPPVIPPPNRPGRRTNVLEDLKTVLNCIWRSRWAYHFRNPVNSVSLGVPDYHTLVKRPMDLNTIKKRLNNNYYWQADEALEDFNLVFDNCMQYNMEGTPVYQAGKELKTAFYNRLGTIDLTKEEELKPKVDKRKRKAPEEPNPNPNPTPIPVPVPSATPSLIPALTSTFSFGALGKCGPSLIPGMNPAHSLLPQLTPAFMPDSLINPIPSLLPIAGTSSMKTVRETDAAAPQATSPLTGLPVPLIAAPIEISPTPTPKPTSAPTPTPTPTSTPAPKSPTPPPPPPPPPKPEPPIICYKDLDRLIEKSHCTHLLKYMTKRKRRQLTWAFNRAEHWERYTQNPDYNHKVEEKLDWTILGDRINSENFEGFDGFVYLVRRMFQNALRCFPEDALVKTSVKNSNEVFERALPKYRVLIAKAKERAREMVAAKQKN
ncbi:hypothetical protein KR009_004068, partial [Drosophila setifemur]